MVSTLAVHKTTSEIISATGGDQASVVFTFVYILKVILMFRQVRTTSPFLSS